MDRSLLAELAGILAPDRVSSRPIDRVAFANDASVYRLVPRAVVFPRTVGEVRGLLAWSGRRGIPLTFRAAGTSLSGQAVTDGVLVVVSRHWRGVEVLDDGRRVRVQPGVIGGAVNRRLRPHGTKLGPDPASIDACMMGGILANNSSGMCCGIESNAYRTLDSMRFLLADGTEVDTARPDAEERLAREAPELCRTLLEMRRRILGDRRLLELLQRKYRMKNTMGYTLCALVDHETPAQMLAHLMIGSEGTLGFIAEAVLRTVPDPPLKYTGLLQFADVPDACRGIEPLRDSGARALELMDRASLRAVQDRPGMPSGMRDLPPEAAALLVEYAAEDAEQLDRFRAACAALLPGLPLAAPADFTRDGGRQAELWRVRKGLIPSVGALRARGTSFIIEDVVFPVPRLARGVAELQRLFRRWDYPEAIVFGHAKDGNLHFVLTQSFDRPREIERYDGFMRELAELVAVRHGGALKAEHGTGRNMAPFVVAEWGETAYALMREIKQAIDPDGRLNPGVILNDDPRAHVRDLKALPEVEAEIDRCIECGFCERMCPSRELTLTPRQRIVVRREMARLRGPARAALERDWRYEALDTCATDGLCATACPVEIDTGAFVRRLRRESHGAAAQEVAVLAARTLAAVERVARGGLHVLGRLPGGRWPRPGPSRRPAAGRRDAAAVWFPSCASRVLGEDPGAALACAESAGAPLRIPGDAAGHCCGLAFSSKGFDRAARWARERTVAAARRWSDGGRLPVVVDSSPCAAELRGADASLRFEDSIDFAHREVLPRLRIRRRRGPVALHAVCSVRRAGLAGKLRELGEACAVGVELPSEGCCGFAGDRGFRTPELTASATRELAVEIEAGHFEACYASSPTCQFGLARATGRPWLSFWQLLAEVSESA